MDHRKLLSEIYEKLGLVSRFESDEDEKPAFDLAWPAEDFTTDDYRTLLKLRDYRAGFLSRLLYRYSEPMQEFEVFVEHCKAIGVNTIGRFGNQMSDKEKALQRLHQKSSLVASEIIYLIKGGYPSAAFARWRTLFETSVIAVLLALNEVELSTRYLEYEIIERKKEMDAYLADQAYLGLSEISRETQERVNNLHAKAINKNGDKFAKDFGWAIHLIGKDRVTLHDLMSQTESQYMRPYYKLSNNYIHGGPKSLLYNLGFIDGIQGGETIAAPSNIGFTDCAQLCALSYFNATMACFSVSPAESDLELLHNLYRMIRQIAIGFQAVEDEIIAKEKAEQ